MLANKKKKVGELSEYFHRKIRKAANEGELERKFYLTDIFAKFNFKNYEEMTPVLQEMRLQLLSMGFNIVLYKNRMDVIWKTS